MTGVQRVKMEVQGDICAFECVNWRQQTDTVSEKEADYLLFVAD